MIVILLLAIIVDFIGEYPSIIHPVVWVGKIIEFFDKRRKKRSKYVEFFEGMILEISTIIFFVLLLYFLFCYFKNSIVGLILQVFFLKASFSIFSLVRHVKRCAVDDTEKLRKNVSMIVSRDVSNLDKDHLYSAAIESGAENIVDSIVSPLFYFIFFGTIGAFVYRIINTFDAMVGYRNEKYEYFGKFAARLDDIANFIPARITGFIFLLLKSKNVMEKLKKYRKLKINGMYTMASMAGVLNVTLEKINYYRIDGKNYPTKDDVLRSIRYIGIVTTIWLIIVIGVLLYGLPWWCKGI